MSRTGVRRTMRLPPAPPPRDFGGGGRGGRGGKRPLAKVSRNDQRVFRGGLTLESSKYKIPTLQYKTPSLQSKTPTLEIQDTDPLALHQYPHNTKYRPARAAAIISPMHCRMLVGRLRIPTQAYSPVSPAPEYRRIADRRLPLLARPPAPTRARAFNPSTLNR